MDSPHLASGPTDNSITDTRRVALLRDYNNHAPELAPYLSNLS
jgi:hypothetical protein